MRSGPVAYIDRMQAIKRKVQQSLSVALASVLFASCVAPQIVTNEPEPSETFYVSMLGTRKHRLSGVNPIVGVFFTRDAGQTWEHIGWEQGKAFAAVVPQGGKGDTVFVAAGNGVLRTTDGGATWRITTGWEVTEVQDIALSPMRRSDVFAATPYGIYRSLDFGSSWTHVADDLIQPYVASIRVDRENPDRVVAGSEGGLYVSIDGGATWVLTTLQYPIRSIRQSPTNSSTWAAALQDRGVALSTDGGSSWTISADLEGMTFYEVEFDPDNHSRLLGGGWKTGLFESTDLGQHWIRIDQDLPTEDIHGLSISRMEDGLVILGSMNDGVYISKDGGRHWFAADPGIFEAGQIWDVHVGGEG